MIKTNEYGGVTVGGMPDTLLSEYSSAGMAIARGLISEGYDARVLMEVLEEEEKK